MIGDDRGTTGEGDRARRSPPTPTVVCGGVSVGEHDHVRPALDALGVEQVFWGVALRPGKPTYFGVAPDGALVFGLPGNPVSAMVTFLLFARPASARCSAPDPGRAGRRRSSTSDYARPPGRAHLVRCRLELARRRLARDADQGAGLARADLDARRRRAGDRAVGRCC